MGFVDDLKTAFKPPAGGRAQSSGGPQPYWTGYAPPPQPVYHAPPLQQAAPLLQHAPPPHQPAQQPSSFPPPQLMSYPQQYSQPQQMFQPPPQFFQPPSFSGYHPSPAVAPAAPPMLQPQFQMQQMQVQVVKPWHAGILVVRAPTGALVVSGVDPKSSMWNEREIKVGDELVAIDGKEATSLAEALKLLKGPKGSVVSVQTQGGMATVERDSNCSLGPASTRGAAIPAAVQPAANPLPFANYVPNNALTPQECASLGLPPGTKWTGGAKAKETTNYSYPMNGGSVASESFLSI